MLPLPHRLQRRTALCCAVLCIVVVTAQHAWLRLPVLRSCAVQKCRSEEAALEASVQAARVKVAEVKEAMSSEKSQSSIMKALVKAKQTKTIAGIHGRLGDLGAIDGAASFLSPE